MGKVETEWSEDQGHYLLVTQHYQQGSTVIKEPPLVFSLPASNWRSQCRRCLAMLQTKKTVHPCPRCFGAHYCCTRCAELDNVIHIGSAECLLMQTNQIRSCAVRPFMREACLAARLLHHAHHAAIALESNQEALLDEQGASGQEAQDLMTTAVAVATARAQATADAANPPSSSSPANPDTAAASPVEPDIAAALTAVCQVATNALEVMPCLIEHCMPGLKGGPAGVGIPLALYRLTSKINHSCCPNAAYFFKPDGTVVVRSMRALHPNEQLTISYTDLLQTLDERQQSLLQRYAFTCCCARCADDSPMPGDWFLDAVAADDLETATELSHDLRRLLRRGSALLLEEGSAAGAVCMLEPGVMQLTGSGVHPLHSSCLDIYTCLSSAWRLLARGNKHKPLLAASAYARGALYILLLAHGLKQLLKSGVDGIMPHHARQLSDAASSILADDLQLATLGATADFNAAGVCPSASSSCSGGNLLLAGSAVLRPVLAHMTSAFQLDFQHEQQLVRLAAATSACLAAASDALQIAFGADHQLYEVNSFLPFSSGLAFEVAAAVTQAASSSRAL
ncbi:hypothetical protein WJX82_008986 [Trebouxia sp. C0006]